MNIRNISFISALALTVAASAGVVNIQSQAHYNQVISQGLVVVDFWSPSCTPCKRMHPIIDQVSQEMPNVTFAKVNIQSLPGIANQMGVQSLPTFLFYKDGAIVGRAISARAKPDFVNLVRTTLSI